MESSKKSGRNIIKAYQQYLRLQRGYSTHTLDAYMRDLEKLLRHLEGEQKDCRQVTLNDLQHFVASLHDIGIGARSQCRILSGLRSFYHFLFMEGEVENDPTELLESPRIGEHLPEVLSIAECIDDSLWVF